MHREFLTDDEVEQENERLSKSEAVKLARKEQRLLMYCRRHLTDFRWLEKRGKKLLEDGWTYDTLDLMYKDILAHD